MGDFYGTGIEIWAGFWSGRQLLRPFFSCFHWQFFFDHENMKKPVSKVAKPAQIQPKSRFLFHKNLPEIYIIATDFYLSLSMKKCFTFRKYKSFYGNCCNLISAPSSYTGPLTCANFTAAISPAPRKS